MPPSTFTASQFVSFIICLAFIKAILEFFSYVPIGISTTNKLFLIPLLTAFACIIIISRVTSLVDFIPCNTIPNESPTNITSQYLSKICAMGVV